MAESDVVVCVKHPLKLSKTLQNKVTLAVKGKLKKSRRLLRRKRKNISLCDTVSVIDLTDMDCHETQTFIQPIPEVAAWQHQHQLAYWKSRAIALEHENKMLYKHLKQVYTQQIQECADYMKEQIQDDAKEDAGERKDEWKYGSKDKSKRYKRDEEIWEAPKEHPSKQKQELTTSLYGSMASKINGMETAIHLKYDLYLDKHKPTIWPNIPLNL